MLSPCRPPPAAPQDGLAKSLQLAQGAAAAADRAVHALLAPFALFDGAWTNVLFWAVLLMFSYVLVLAPRQ